MGLLYVFVGALGFFGEKGGSIGGFCAEFCFSVEKILVSF